MSDLCGQFYFSGIIICFQNYQWTMVDNTEVKSLNLYWLFLPCGVEGRKVPSFPLDREIKDRRII